MSSRADWSDDDLRRALAARRDEGPGEHPEPDRLWSLATGELPPADAREVVDHLSRCPACAEDFRLTRGLAEEAAAGGPPTEAPGPTVVPFPAPRRARLVASAVAATLVLATGLTLWIVPRGDDSPPVYRQEPGARQIDSVVSESLERGQVRLAWTPLQGARYDVVLATPELEVVARIRGLEEPSWTVPLASLDGAPPRLVWQVEAILPDGLRVASPPFDLRLLDASGEKQGPRDE